MSMREEFEAWFFGKKGITELGADNNPYASSHAQAAWWAWQTSRNAVVIELPEPAIPERFGVTQVDDPERFEELEALCCAQHATIQKCRRAIEAAGLKVKV